MSRCLQIITMKDLHGYPVVGIDKYRDDNDIEASPVTMPLPAQRFGRIQLYF